MNRFVFTCGDINGIGPEIVLKTLNKITKTRSIEFIFICPANVFKSTLKKIPVNFKFVITEKYKGIENYKSKVVILSPGNFRQCLGQPTKTSGSVAYQALKLSFSLINQKIATAVITAPVSKMAFKLAGYNFPGQTEMFAKWCNTQNFVMTFLSNKMNAGLYSIHIPLKKISNSLNYNKLLYTVQIIYNTLKVDLNQNNPSIALLGVNPHAGEGGLIGLEEKQILIPFIKRYSKRFNIFGPYSPDAFFANKMYENFNMILGIYHDQVLIPFKLLNKGKGVNFTAGLPIIRTSPDHGVAYDIAGKNSSDESSMLEAFKYAASILKNRNKLIS